MVEGHVIHYRCEGNHTQTGLMAAAAPALSDPTCTPQHHGQTETKQLCRANFSTLAPHFTTTSLEYEFNEAQIFIFFEECKKCVLCKDLLRSGLVDEQTSLLVGYSFKIN